MGLWSGSRGDGAVRARSTKLAGVIVLAALFAALPAASASAQTTIEGTLTITGSEGRDDLTVESTASGFLEITPAVTTSATVGSCANVNDAATGRPIQTRCRISPARPTDIIMDLGGGNDGLNVGVDVTQQGTGLIRIVTANGGAGNDVITMNTLIDRVFIGGDGDDTLAAPGRTASQQEVEWDGGAGTDLADFGGSTGFVFDGSSNRATPLHVTASLATKTAVLSRPPGVGDAGLVTVRTDDLQNIEGLVGGEVGDILTGGATPSTLVGGDGPDNLIGGELADSLSGGAGLDSLNGGKGGDTLDGGTEIDTYAKGDGGDTYLIRDGFAETVACVTAKDVVVADLVDKVAEPAKCLSVSVAQAKHRYDTTIGGRAALKGGGVQARLSCPKQKTEACRGTLRASPAKGGATLGSARYRIPPGKSERVTLDTGPGARSLVGSKLKLRLSETDADKLPRKVVRRVPLKGK